MKTIDEIKGMLEDLKRDHANIRSLMLVAEEANNLPEVNELRTEEAKLNGKIIALEWTLIH